MGCVNNRVLILFFVQLEKYYGLVYERGLQCMGCPWKRQNPVPGIGFILCCMIVYDSLRNTSKPPPLGSKLQGSKVWNCCWWLIYLILLRGLSTVTPKQCFPLGPAAACNWVACMRAEKCSSSMMIMRYGSRIHNLPFETFLENDLKSTKCTLKGNPSQNFTKFSQKSAYIWVLYSLY